MTSTNSVANPTAAPQDKPVHTLILDAGPLIKNDPASSSLLSHSHRLLTLPSIVSELLDATTRSRFDVTLRPFVELRNPKPESMKVVSDFARKTGDFGVLSKVDLGVLALAYEVECERNGGDWRLRRVPGQKRMNGPPPSRSGEEGSQEANNTHSRDESKEDGHKQGNGTHDIATDEHNNDAVADDAPDMQGIMDGTADMRLNTEDSQYTEEELHAQQTNDDEYQQQDESDSDGEWITPSNLRKRQAQHATAAPESSSTATQPKTMQVATLTTDFAMQNVLLQMNLNLLSPSLQRVRHIKTYILRCHACFEKVKDLSKQFCPRCGGPTLTRVACSTNENGEFKLHLKKNFQWNNRGNRYSIPKPVPSSASGKVHGKGGGKGAWGQGLILTEDQKEYANAVGSQKRGKERDLMDEDFLPGIISGDRSKSGGGRPKIGAGRGVNSTRRR